MNYWIRVANFLDKKSYDTLSEINNNYYLNSFDAKIKMCAFFLYMIYLVKLTTNLFILETNL